jgi:phosphatidylinositol 4-kinase
LDDFGHRIQQQQQQQALASTGSDNVGPGNNYASSSLSPFRVMLQLFAYEDVLDNHKLDAVFEIDDGAALTFYVPQLLSFLLHGAFHSSPALEEWILLKCRKNIYFAHKCYWYLRAWCLEVPAESRPITPSISRRNSATSLGSNILTNGAIGAILSQQTAQQQNQSNSDGLPFLDEPAVHEKKQLSSGSNGSSRNLCLPDISSSNSNTSQNDIRLSSVVLSNGAVITSPNATEKNKFVIPEERAMIERFMMRVKECGQIPAFALEYGTITISTNGSGSISHADEISVTDQIQNSSDDTPGHLRNFISQNLLDRSTSTLTYRGLNPSFVGNSTVSGATHVAIHRIETEHGNNNGITPSSTITAMKLLADDGKIPTDPVTGIPSNAHYDALILQQKCNANGFRARQYVENDIHSELGMPLGAARRSETEQFDKTPQFLDALIFLAENLYHIPRENRRETLQQQLRSLECELLPCNSIYLPLGNRNQYHRIWRIAADESIAISTKERVPCIIVLEAIDFTLSSSTSSSSYHEANNMNGRFVDESSVGNGNAGNGTNLSALPSVNQNAPIDTDCVAEWRYGFRNPLRYVPFFDKVTTSVKVPFAKMQTQVRHHFNHLRDRGVSEETQALSSADALIDRQHQTSSGYDLVEPADIGEHHMLSDGNTMENEFNSTLLEAENGASLKLKDQTLPAMSSSSNITTAVSLGQWSSPSALQRAARSSDKQPQHDMHDLRLRLDTVLPNRNSRSNPLLYGSDQEDESSERSMNTASGRPPSGRQPLIASAKDANSVKDQAVSTRPPPVVFRESWVAKQERVRQASAMGNHPGWKLLAILIKGNDDLRQEQLAAQLIKRMATILASEKVSVWLCPYEIIATTNRGGVIEAIPDTISIDSLKKNDPNYTSLNDFFHSHYGDGTDELAGAKANFVESLAAYSMVCFILQLKDRHNGNILLDKWGHVIHIDFGFFFLSSPGKNAGFESAPFKLTREFVELLEGTSSHLFRTFRELCFKTFIALRRRCMEIILLVEMLKNGNEDLKCFRGRPDDAIQQLRDRFRLDLNDRACKEYVNSLIDDSIENWRTDWYDRYQRYFVGVM